MDIKKIREAICRNRGGHEGTGDAGIMRLWNALDEETRKKYLAVEVTEKKIKSFPVPGTKIERS
ncbi:MAG: hypothetical protein ABII09_03570 [Planctomycetota bacterium]